MGGVEEKSTRSREESERTFISDIIKEFYSALLEFDILIKDLYEMTIKELEITLENRRKGMANKIWRLAVFTHSPFVSEFPKSPREAMPDLFPIQKGIPMPDFLKEKAMKRGVM